MKNLHFEGKKSVYRHLAKFKLKKIVKIPKNQPIWQSWLQWRNVNRPGEQRTQWAVSYVWYLLFVWWHHFSNYPFVAEFRRNRRGGSTCFCCLQPYIEVRAYVCFSPPTLSRRKYQHFKVFFNIYLFMP